MSWSTWGKTHKEAVRRQTHDESGEPLIRDPRDPNFLMTKKDYDAREEADLLADAELQHMYDLQAVDHDAQTIKSWAVKAYNRGIWMPEEQATRELTDLAGVFPAVSSIARLTINSDETLLPIIQEAINRDDPYELDIARHLLLDLAHNTRAHELLVRTLKEKAQARGVSVNWTGLHRYHITQNDLSVGLYGQENTDAHNKTIVGLSRLASRRQELQELEDSHSEWLRGVDAVVSARMPEVFSAKALQRAFDEYVEGSEEQQKYLDTKQRLEVQIEELTRQVS